MALGFAVVVLADLAPVADVAGLAAGVCVAGLAEFDDAGLLRVAPPAGFTGCCLAADVDVGVGLAAVVVVFCANKPMAKQTRLKDSNTFFMTLNL